MESGEDPCVMGHEALCTSRGFSLRENTENKYYKVRHNLFRLKYLPIANFTRTYGPYEPLTRTVEGVLRGPESEVS